MKLPVAAIVFVSAVLALSPVGAQDSAKSVNQGPAAPPAIAPDPHDPPASSVPSANGKIPANRRPTASRFTGTGNGPPQAAKTATSVQVTSTPDLYYWDNGYQTKDKSICAINNLASLTFYVQDFICSWDHCLGGLGANPYRWSIWLYRNGTVIWQQSGIQTSTAWINYPVTLSTPLQAGSYHAELKLEKRVFLWSWQTIFDTTTGSINFTAPSTPIGQAPVPVIRLEVVANAGSDMLYQLRGWQTNGNSTLAGQWETYNSDALGTQGSQVAVNWATPGTHIVLPSNLNLNQWYMLKYGNYSQCYSWNETRRLIYIKK